MDLADQIVGRNGDDGKGSNQFPTMRMTPVRFSCPLSKNSFGLGLYPSPNSNSAFILPRDTDVSASSTS